ncbi:1487_t:CDS:2 [Entrophospora sp. SA101]|nr:5687_t:CDS:2 [Entrophospora sp. SA101]CAJ0747198.1 1487_t:CDS:2 [Entrophospora sp. SA101]CAJ0832437.1 9725_t:CDS:2 [Entrophospora sp. SA101]CAJ0922205.1 3033_t:CDS:2 [Entrophospora sp. SA101]
MTQLQIKAFITDIESKVDKNVNPFYKITLQGTSDYFYAFSNSLPQETLSTLTNDPFNFINRQVLITYQELPNKDQQGTFRRIKQIEILQTMSKKLQKQITSKLDQLQKLLNKINEAQVINSDDPET